MKNYLLAILVTLLFSVSNADADVCKVKDADIAGEYSGGCINGFANGKGTAIGRDKYVGEFRNGMTHGSGIYKWPNGSFYDGEHYQDKRNGFGTLKIVRGDGSIESWEKKSQGKWVGNYYVVQGVFSDGNLVRSCTSIANCKNAEHQEYVQREQSNKLACRRLYVGKPVTLTYANRGWGNSTAKAVIVGIGDGVASARVNGGDAYDDYGYGINSVHERNCSEY